MFSARNCLLAGLGAALAAALALAYQPSAGPNVMDEPLRLVREARQVYQGVRDYSCLFVKRERLRGLLQPEQLVAMKVRTQPFSVYLRWLGPQANVGQEACYVAGKHNGMMRAKSAGLLGSVGFVTIDPRDGRAMEHNRHSITEAGLGNVIERFARGWETERPLGLTQVRVGDFEYNKRRCTRVETTHTGNGGGKIVYYRSLVYFDQETRLPVRVENYDWPRQGGAPAGDLLESYSYADLKLNVGLTERDFDH